MKYYIAHNDKLVERKKHIEQYNLQNVEWVTSYPIEELQNLTKITHLPLGYISCNMKHYEAMSRMIKDDVKEAIIFEDDVIITEFFNPEKIPKQFPFVKLGKGTPDMNIQIGDNPIQIFNNGGSEAYYIKQEFAREFLKNIDLKWTIDIEEHAFLISRGIPLVCVPMCYQEFETSFNKNAYEPPYSWQEYIQKYQTSNKMTFEQVKKLCIE